MEPLWEYRWAYEDEWFGVIECKFWMTDDEAKLWHAYGKKGTRRLDETRRDRNLQPKPSEQALSHASVAAGTDPLPEFASPTTDEMHKSRTALRSFAMFAPPATVSARCLIWGATASTG
ncbi:hypothetical protein KTE50_02945 [Burkholderia multivorans]|uniref:hypothetical protein n=1 Tax=Burkholderia multivorans TaxID=87883 RepID=UPI001C25C38D|nr:hypothetical protein [Burkholderia multivorans]MBU9547502.1 hypothetical protein [Burkholderia multivorans]